MIKFENTEVMGWEHAIRGMRNPMNSWINGDSSFCEPGECLYCGGNSECDGYGQGVLIGPNDLDLMKRLRNAGTDHRKFMRMIVVYVDITAPLYWWKEFDTYKVGTVANSCSTMHKIAAKEFTLEDFSCEHLMGISEQEVPYNSNVSYITDFKIQLEQIISSLNNARELYLETKDKKYWWQMIQLLPSSYNQKRTVMMNYEVLANIYKSRKNHKLDEWAEHQEVDLSKVSRVSSDDGMRVKAPKKIIGFCDWIKTLPYSELITGPSLSDIPIANEIMEEAKRRVEEE